EDGRVVVDINEKEVEDLSAFGTSAIPPREPRRRDFLGGMAPHPHPVREEQQRRGNRGDPSKRALGAGALIKTLGPGVIAGASDNDPTTVGTMAVVGAQTGFGLCWLLVLVFPMMASIQSIASAVGVA